MGSTRPNQFTPGSLAHYEFVVRMMDDRHDHGTHLVMEAATEHDPFGLVLCDAENGLGISTPGSVITTLAVISRRGYLFAHGCIADIAIGWLDGAVHPYDPQDL